MRPATDGLRHDIPCITDVLADSGYETAWVGKTHWERNDPVFDENENYVGSTTAPGGHHMNDYDTYIPPGAGRHGSEYWFQCVKDVHWDPRVYSSDPSRIDGKEDGKQHRPKEYSPRLEADVMIDYLKNTHGARDPSKPFCAFWSPNPPHSPYSSEEDCDPVAWREHYRDRSPQELLVRDNVIEGDSRPLAEKRAPFYFANVTGVDTQIGRVLDALEASGEADNTIVIFTSDHGEMMGSQGRFGKLVIFEESFCVPYLVRFPGHIRHRLEDLMISTVDIMPTVLGLMGLQDRIPSTVAGRDFSHELLTGDWRNQPKPESALFLGYGNQFKGVRTDRYSYQIDEGGDQSVWDNLQDPYQMHPKALERHPAGRRGIPSERVGPLVEGIGRSLVSGTQVRYDHQVPGLTRRRFAGYPFSAARSTSSIAIRPQSSRRCGSSRTVEMSLKTSSAVAPSAASSRSRIWRRARSDRPVVTCDEGGIGLDGEHVVVGSVVSCLADIATRADREFAQVRDAFQHVEFDVQLLATAVIGQAPAFQPAHLVAERKLPMHVR